MQLVEQIPIACVKPVVKIAVALLGLACLHAEQNSIRKLDGTTITKAAAESFASKTLAAAKVTGAQIAVLDRGRLVWYYSYGVRHKDPVLPMDRETTLWAASITKSVFATYVMQLVERGEFSLDTPVAQQLRQPLDTFKSYLETATELVKDPAWLTVTPRMLLSHTSSLANFSFLEPDKKMHLHAQPGKAYRYSGDGLNIVQFLIEQKKGRPLDQLMEEAIFNPLGMSRTGMIYRKEFEANVADRFNENEIFLSQTRRFPARASGNMTSSAEDLARFASALLTNKIIQPKSRKVMLKPQVQIRTLHQFAFAENEPEGEEAARVGLAYGLGWGLLTKTPYGPAFFKEGHGDGAQNYMICFEHRKACMILLTNSENGEFAFRPLLETIFGNTFTPWEWEGYAPALIEAARKNR